MLNFDHRQINQDGEIVTETKVAQPTRLAPAADWHPVAALWEQLMVQLRAELQRRQLSPDGVVVLLPYAQLIEQARRAWLRAVEGDGTQSFFLPHFETSLSWSRSLGSVELAADDLRLDAAHDLVTAGSLLARAGLAAQQDLLAARLLQAAWSLAPSAAAVPPSQRLSWGAGLGAELAHQLDAPLFALEAAVARIALAWVSSSGYATDLLFDAEPQLLVLLEGFQHEPLNRSLQQMRSERTLLLSLCPTTAKTAALDGGQVAWHEAHDIADEAQLAAACVLAQLAAGRAPVALVAQDRLLTRRVSALLTQLGLSIRDETGWRLSTTRAGAVVMSLLRAARWPASSDEVLDWLKNAPVCQSAGVDEIEIELRRRGVRDWSLVAADLADVATLSAAAQSALTLAADVRQALSAARPLTCWLNDFRAVLQQAGHWPRLSADPAGQALLQVLCLDDAQQGEFAAVRQRLSLQAFTAWVGQVLDDVGFRPESESAAAQLVILPLGQLLGRDFAAVVLPGCDEVHWPSAPEPPGQWSASARVALGLASRAELIVQARASWNYALQFPWLDILWRHSEDGEPLMASAFVQELLLAQTALQGRDARLLRAVTARPAVMPRPSAAALALTHLSSTAYEDLRRCPYRFFALRLLKLRDAEELDAELDKRDFGNWLHCVLRIFHEMPPHLQSTPQQRLVLLDQAAQQATAELGLAESEFLPFMASWPRVRVGYLRWLQQHETDGAVFVAAESWHETALGNLTLVGKIDRIDRLADGQSLLIDYKTEPLTVSAERCKATLEDTQLAFYAALLTDDTLAATYLNVGEKDGTKGFAQRDVVSRRDLLLESIDHDMRRIKDGGALAAMGEGKVCDYCAARGLCRKDFWHVSATPAPV